MSMNYFSRNLKFLREKHEKTQAEVAIDLHFNSTSRLTNYEVGTSTPNLDTIVKISDYFSVSIDELVCVDLSIKKQNKTEGIPVYNIDFAAGDVTTFADNREAIIGRVDLDGYNRCVAFVRVKGDSMFNRLTQGDFIGLEPHHNLDEIEFGQIYAITTKSNNRFVKQVRKHNDPSKIFLHSINKDYDDIELKIENILAIFKVRGPIRDPFY